MHVDLVNVQTSDGVRLDGAWCKPSSEKASGLPIDAMVLHHGVAGNFYQPSVFDDFGDALLNRGCAVFRVNNRGHDPVSQAAVGDETRRFGGAYEDMEDCVPDWEAWLDFVQAAGYEKIGIWGHSLGATKSIYYMAAQQDLRVRCVIASSPPRFSHSVYSTLEEGEEFRRLYAQAQGYLEGGRPDALMDITIPFPILITARAFIQKYGPEETYDILKHIPRVPVPLLITIGTAEAQTLTSFKGLPPLVARLAGEVENLSFESIPGADHAYTGKRAYVWEVVGRWLGKL